MISPIKTLRGLLAAGLTVVTLLAVSSASATLVKYNFIYSGVTNGNTATAIGVITIDTSVLQNPGTNDNSFGPGSAIVNVIMTISGATSGNGTFSTKDFSNYYFDFPDTVDLSTQWVGQPLPADSDFWGDTDDGGGGDFNFFSNGSNPNAPSGEWYFTLETAGGDEMQLISVTPAATGTAGVIYQKGDAVPGLAAGTFTSFGTPAINDNGEVAFYGTWKTNSNQTGSGIFVNGALLLKVGDKLAAPSGTVKILSMQDPVIDDAGNVAFLVTLGGTNITLNNNSAVVTTAPNGILSIVAQTGTQAAGAPAHVVYNSFTSVALPGGGEGVLISGVLSHSPGGIVPKKTDALWAGDPAGNLNLILLDGTTVIGSKTVKSFTVLNTVAGSTGQTHAFNGSWQLVANVTYTDGTSAIVMLPLP
jgi:hypothetical protein